MTPTCRIRRKKFPSSFERWRRVSTWSARSAHPGGTRLFRRMASRIVNKAARQGHRRDDARLRLHASRVSPPHRRCHAPVPRTKHVHSRFGQRFRPQTRPKSKSTTPRDPAGDSKYSLWRLINLQFDLLTSMTTFPAASAERSGRRHIDPGHGLWHLPVVMRIIHGPEWAVDGVFTLFSILFIFIGAQFVAMGLLGRIHRTHL